MTGMSTMNASGFNDQLNVKHQKHKDMLQCTETAKHQKSRVDFHGLKGTILSKKATQKNIMLGFNLFKQLLIQLIS